MNPVTAADPASKVAYTFTDVGALHNAIKLYGYIPLRADGTPMETQYLKEYDGYILDGAPINVWIEGSWQEGQREALEPYWQAGTIRRPTANVLNLTVTPMSPETTARTAAYKAATAGGLFGLDTGTLVALGAGAVAIWWISRK